MVVSGFGIGWWHGRTSCLLFSLPGFLRPVLFSFELLFQGVQHGEDTSGQVAGLLVVDAVGGEQFAVQSLPVGLVSREPVVVWGLFPSGRVRVGR
ncbi:hypothetical protein [Actinocorallia populi]|uniref:hypothetical protein n=1 Tax=Actinocorallia populi TaxID=2079200 RepID=UPI0018E5587E|nr:hypothetical protein [Actinocorallia populi]